MSHPLHDFGLGSDVLVWQAVLLTAISFGVGVLGGFVGLAMGTMRLPPLLLLGVPSPLAAGTNILVSTLSALTGSVRHLREGRVDMRVVLVMGLPAAAGALIGGLSAGQVPVALLLGVAGLLVTWQGIGFMARARSQRDAPAHRPRDPAPIAPGGVGLFTRNRVVAEAGIGFVVGLLGGAVGLILGSIRLPAMVRILRIDPRVAAGTNLFIGFILGSFGWTGYVLRGQVDYPLLVAMGVAGMAGSSYGARLTGRVRTERLVLTMGWVMLVLGALLIRQAIMR